MTYLSNTTAPIPSEPSGGPGGIPQLHALVIGWSAAEPWRAGEVALLGRIDPEGRHARAASEPWTLGRGNVVTGRRVRFYQQRPASLVDTGPLTDEAISRQQLTLRPTPDGLAVARVGKRKLFVNDEERESGVLQPGDIVRIGTQLVLLCTARPVDGLPRTLFFTDDRIRPFGEPDTFRILGESPVVWATRERIAALAKATAHILIRGESGTGKELAANALHLLSARRDGPIVSRNAATFPEGVMDAELFGCAKGFPNGGTPERIGLVAEADGGTLFLDEIGELEERLQAKLLRLLDNGEFRRLGETGTRRTDLRFVGATNRPLDAIKHDVLARLVLRLVVPSLAERREDIPLLARHLMLQMAEKSPEVAGRFVFQRTGGRPEVRMDGRFVDCLLRREYPTNVRDLAGVLWDAVYSAPGDTLVASRELVEECRRGDPGRVATETEGDGLTKERVQACLERHRWLLDPAAEELRLTNRYALRRLMKRLGIAKRRS